MPACHPLLVALLHEPELIIQLLAQVTLHILRDALDQLIRHLLIVGGHSILDQFLKQILQSQRLCLTCLWQAVVPGVKRSHLLDLDHVFLVWPALAGQRVLFLLRIGHGSGRFMPFSKPFIPLRILRIFYCRHFCLPDL